MKRLAVSLLLAAALAVATPAAATTLVAGDGAPNVELMQRAMDYGSLPQLDDEVRVSSPCPLPELAAERRACSDGQNFAVPSSRALAHRTLPRLTMTAWHEYGHVLLGRYVTPEEMSDFLVTMGFPGAWEYQTTLPGQPEGPEELFADVVGECAAWPRRWWPVFLIDGFGYGWRKIGVARSRAGCRWIERWLFAHGAERVRRST